MTLNYCRAEKKYERKVFSGGINSFLKIRIRIRQVFLAFNRKNTNSIRPEFFSFQDTNTNPKNTKRIPGRILFVFFPGLTVIKVTIADGPSVSFPLPLRITQKLPVRNSWGLKIKELPTPLPIVYYFELIREVLANTGCSNISARSPGICGAKPKIHGELPP